MKAKLKGKVEDVKRLEAKLAEARKAAQAAPPPPSAHTSHSNRNRSTTTDEDGESVEIVAPYDIHGRRLSSLTKSERDMPLEPGDLRTGRNKGKRKAADALAEHSNSTASLAAAGKKIRAAKLGVGARHASTDSNYSLQDLVRLEREGGEDMDANYFRSVVQVR